MTAGPELGLALLGFTAMGYLGWRATTRFDPWHGTLTARLLSWITMLSGIVWGTIGITMAAWVAWSWWRWMPWPGSMTVGG